MGHRCSISVHHLHEHLCDLCDLCDCESVTVLSTRVQRHFPVKLPTTQFQIHTISILNHLVPNSFRQPRVQSGHQYLLRVNNSLDLAFLVLLLTLFLKHHSRFTSPPPSIHRPSQSPLGLQSTNDFSFPGPVPAFPPTRLPICVQGSHHL